MIKLTKLDSETLENMSIEMNSQTVRVCTASTIKAPLDIVNSFVNYHLNLGIYHMYLFFDDPNDGCISHFNTMECVTAIPCTKQHWERLNVRENGPIEERQISNAHYALTKARERGFSWLIHIDVDELIYSENNLLDYLSNVPEGVYAVSFRSMEAIPEKLEYEHSFSEISLFKDLQANRKYKKAIAYLLGCRNILRDGFFKGHVDGKSAVRTTANVINLHIHKPSLGDGQQTIVSDSTRLLHFDAVSYSQWHTKWIRRYDGSATANNLGPSREKQYKRFIAALESGPSALQTLYSAEYMIPNIKLIILELLGYVRRIRLNRELFKR